MTDRWGVATPPSSKKGGVATPLPPLLAKNANPPPLFLSLN